ncbi:unnamed protein product [Closterium sp. NIES-54]
MQTVDPVEPVEVAVNSGAARGAEPAGAGTGGVGPGVAVSEGAEPGGAEPEREEPEGAKPGGAESGSAEPWGAEPKRAENSQTGVPSQREPLSPQQLREWYTLRCRRAAGAGAAGGASRAAGGASGAGAAGGAAGVRAAGGAAGAGAAGGTAGAGAAGAAGPGGTGAGSTGAVGAAAGVGAAGAGAVATGGAAGAGAVGVTGAGGAEGVVAGDPGDEGTGAVSAVSGGAARPRLYYVPLLQQSRSESLVRAVRTSRRVPRQCPPPVPGTHYMTLRPSTSESPVRAVCTSRRVPRQCPPPVPGTHYMTLRPSTTPQRVPLLSPPASSLPDGPDPKSDSLRAASPTVTRFLATAVTDPFFESTAASALVVELVDFAAACRLDYATGLVGGECALSTDVLDDRQEEFECFAATVPHLVSMLLAPEGDLDAPDILTPRSYAEAIEGPYSSQWQAAMDAEMASWKSTGTYVDEVPPPGANIRSSQGYTFSLGSGSVSSRSTCSSSVLNSSCEAEIYAGAMAAQELRWLTYLLIDLGEAPRSPLNLYVDNKAMLAWCQEHRLEHRTKHIALRYFLARELQQRG